MIYAYVVLDMGGFIKKILIQKIICQRVFETNL